MLRCGRFLLALAIILATPLGAGAQSTDAQPSPSPSPSPSTVDQLLKPEQLEALVAPIALYPDALLANMLAASTYPLEVVEADRWLKENKKLKGDQLKTGVDKKAWDDSVKALTATPTVLDMMNDRLDWTKSLGDAVLAQQADVMDAIQRLRFKAQANNKLVSTKQQKVTVQAQENKQVIVIEPTSPDSLYVPYYDPAVVYGTWPYAEYPPYYWGYPSYIGAGVIAAGLAFGTAWAIGRWGNYWGGGFNWGNRNLYVNHFNRNTNWTHNSIHRQGVRYNNANVAQRFGNNNVRAGAADRMDFRGRNGQQVLNPGRDRAGAGDRVGDRAGDRVGDRAGDRAGDRGRGDRAGAGDRAGGNRQAKGDRGGGNRSGAKHARSADRSRGGGAASRSGGRDNAMRMQSGRAASAQAARGRQSFASAGGPRGGARAAMGGGARSMGGGGFRGGGGGGGFRGGGGGGRRSDLALKHDVKLLGHLDNGLGYYRFSYLGSDKAFVGVIAQEVQAVRPDAVWRARDGYLRVDYDKLGIKFRSYQEWLAGGAKIPAQGRI
jgi:Protein of unknown function (DUF3300)